MKKERLRSCFAASNRSRATLPIEDVKGYAALGEWEALLGAARLAHYGLAEAIRQASLDSGLKICNVADILAWPRTPMCRFNQRKSDQIPLSVLVTLSDLCEVSIDKLIYGDDPYPLVLPDKHAMWIRRMRLLPPDSKYRLMIQLRCALDPGPKPVTVDDHRRLASDRLTEYVDNAAIRLEDLGRERGLVLTPDHRLMLQHISQGGSFKAATPKLLFYALLTGCSLEYYLRWDYSQYTGEFADSAGNTVKLDKLDRGILSVLLRSGDQVKAVRSIGWLCAAAEACCTNNESWLPLR